MKISLSKNSWVVTVTELDLNAITDEEIDILGCLVNYYTLVIIKDQKNLPVELQESVCRRFGSTLDDDYGIEGFKQRLGRLLQPGGTITSRVTGEKNEDGEPGLFGFKEELKWHANKVERANRRSMVWIYGVRGTKGSVTSFTNHIIAYNDMPEEFKKEISGLKTIYSYQLSKDERERMGQDVGISEHTPPLVYTNAGGQTGIYLSWLHLDHFVGMTTEESKIIAGKIEKFVLSNPRYVYDHEWTDGDLLLSEQWLGLHKRHAFEHMEQRLINRIETSFSKIDFTKMPMALKMIDHE